MKIGRYSLRGNLVLAPMAGITDRPFRVLCRELGAAMAISEMVSSDPQLQGSRRTRLRRDHAGEPEPRVVQIVGADPIQMAQAARFNVDHGAQIIDINMGCPARKVCNVAAGSALLRNEALVASILEHVVAAVPVPVTLKIRTGWDGASRNAVRVARIAEGAGVQALAVHGRTRACAFAGHAEHDTVRAVKASVSIPVLANGDIDSAGAARAVLAHSGADGLMIGRAAQGRPWIFHEIAHFLATGAPPPAPSRGEIWAILRRHLERLYGFYGELQGVRVARKHVGWYLRAAGGTESVRTRVNLAGRAGEQLAALTDWFTGDMLEAAA
ncbi:MAG: tRNA dihydrouridine synthase DusB [Gammaproteobacteria bacterium]|nr:tRNA dihydrouridine synthase DusB [Gammaproteobacteria bacterium]